MKNRIARSLLLAVCAFAVGCVAPTNAPPGVPRGIAFGVTPVYPSSFDIVATGPLKRSGDVLRDAWNKKAEEVAAGRPFKVSRMTERVSEQVAGGYPIRSRSVSGTVTVIGNDTARE